MVLRPKYWCLALSCLVTLTPGLFAGVLLDLESVPIGTVLNNGVGRYQHTNAKHSNPNTFLATQDDENEDGFVAAFNGASADAGNPEAIFGGGKTHTIILGDIPTTSDGFFSGVSPRCQSESVQLGRSHRYHHAPGVYIELQFAQESFPVRNQCNDGLRYG